MKGFPDDSSSCKIPGSISSEQTVVNDERLHKRNSIYGVHLSQAHCEKYQKVWYSKKDSEHGHFVYAKMAYHLNTWQINLGSFQRPLHHLLCRRSFQHPETAFPFIGSKQEEACLQNIKTLHYALTVSQGSTPTASKPSPARAGIRFSVSRENRIQKRNERLTTRYIQTRWKSPL